MRKTFLLSLIAAFTLGWISVNTSHAAGDSKVLYHVNLQDVDGYFLASRFSVLNDDIIYVANASGSQLQKFLTLIGAITQPIVSGVVVTKTFQ